MILTTGINLVVYRCNCKITYSDNDIVYTWINATEQEAKEYFYIGKERVKLFSPETEVRTTIISCEILETQKKQLL